MIRRTLAVATIVAGSVIGIAGPALADHGHFVIRTDRDGTAHCRYIAEGQTSKGSDEPGGHAFHDHVHTGQPGADEHGTDFDKDSNEAGRCDTVQ